MADKDDETKTSLPGLFDYLNDLTQNKQYIFADETSKNYNQFIINRGLMQHIDTIMLAGEMNKRGMVNLMHYDFLYYSIDAKKRFGKWAKQDETDLDLLTFIQNKYSVNRNVALEYIDLLDKSELRKLKSELENKGGLK